MLEVRNTIALVLAAIFTMAATFAVIDYRQSQIASPFSGPVSQVVQALVEDRCLPFLNESPRDPAKFDKRGLVPAPPKNGDTTFLSPNGEVELVVKVIDAENAGCVLGEVTGGTWSKEERERVEAFGLALGEHWITESFETVDLREQTGFPMHSVERPVDGNGRFVMTARSAFDDGTPYTFITVGYGVFEAGDNDV